MQPAQNRQTHALYDVGKMLAFREIYLRAHGGLHGKMTIRFVSHIAAGTHVP